MSRLWMGLLLGAALMGFMGCNTFGDVSHGPVAEHPQVTGKGHGPPPHAPAHGYRHKHEHQTLEYDREAGAYVVVHVPDTYFFDGLYMRLSQDGRWVVSTTLHSGWRLAVGNEVPYKLKTYKKKSKQHKHKKNKAKD